MKKILALLLAVLMVLSLVACTKAPADTTTKGAAGDTTAAPAGDEADDTTVAPAGNDEEFVLDALINSTAGVMEGWLYDMIYASTGCRINYIGYEGDINAMVSTLAAEGQLPPLVKISDTTVYNTCIEAGLLEPLDDYLDDELNNYPYYAQLTIDAMRALASNGTGKLYGIPSMFTTAPAGIQDYAGFQIRWDYYAELGYPDIVGYDGLNAVLKQMVDNHPTADNGDKTYGINLSKSDSGYTTGWKYICRSRGLWATKYTGIMVEMAEWDGVDTSKLHVYSIADKNGGYYDYLKWLFDANQMGILDPDSKTQDSDAAGAGDKTYNGEVCFQFDTWGTLWDYERNNEGKGYKFWHMTDSKYVNDNGEAAPIGGGTYLCLGAGWDEKTTKKALDVMNYILDPLFLTASQNGPNEGVIDKATWTINEDGAPYVIESGVELQADQSTMLKDRGKNIFLSYGTHHVTPGLGGYSTDRWSWIQEDYMPEDHALNKDFKAHANAISNHEWLLNNDMCVTPPATFSFALSDEDDQNLQRMAADINRYSWAMIYAADEAEFESLWTEFSDMLIDMGIEEVADNYEALYMDAVEAMLPYTNTSEDQVTEYLVNNYKD